ncbi:MAG: two-component regulator propeller domain-containing protein, partial [Wenzhouxiangellaceae bacterium]
MTTTAADSATESRRWSKRMRRLLAHGLCGFIAAGAAVGVQALNPEWQASQFLHETYTREDGLPADVVWTVTQTRQGYLWLGTQNGLVRFDGVRFTTFNAQNTPAFASSDVRTIAESSAGTLWLGTYGGGALHLAGGEFSKWTSEDGLADDIVYDIFVAGDGAVWFATAGGASRLQDGEIESWTQADGLVANRVFRIAEADNGDLWLATLTGGLSRFDGETFTNYTPDDGLDSVQMHMLFADETGLLAGSYTGGLFRLGAERNPEALPRGDLPVDLPMQSALRDGDGNLWIGSYGRGLWRWQIGGQARPFDLGRASPTHIFDLLEDREGNVWAATMNGLHRLSEGLFLAWGEPEGLADATFVVAEHDDAILVGAEGRGLYRLADNGEISRTTTEDGLSSNSVSALMVDADNRIWAGTFGGGVNVIDGDRIRHIDTGDGLSSDHVFAIHQHSDRSVWIAAEGGINRLRDGEIEVLTGDDGFPGGLARHIMEDASGRLWFATNDGLVRYDRGQVRTWDQADGLAGGLVSTTWQDPDGTVWIGMRNGGLARLDDEVL